KSPEIKAPFDRDKYKDTHKGFRIASISTSTSFQAVRPMNLYRAAAEAAISRRTGYTFFPSVSLDARSETRLPVGFPYEKTSRIRSGRMGFAYFGIEGNVFDVESLWEDTPSQDRPPNGVGLLSCFQFIYSALLFGRLYYPAFGYSGDFHVRFALESAVPRTMF